jgi:hypothetical protein
VNAGNLVRIEDGCATVTGYEFPEPLRELSGKAETRFEASSQDTGLAVLVVVLRNSAGPTSPSKRRMRPEFRTVSGAARNAFILVLSGVKVFSSLALVSRL